MDLDPLPIIKKRQSRHLRAGRSKQEPDSPPDTPNGSSPGATPEPSPATLAAKLKKKQKAVTRLSFGGDEDEGPSFSVKKSTLSRNISLRPHPSLSVDGAPSIPAAVSQRPTYSAADLSTLKANTPSSAHVVVRSGEEFDLDDEDGISEVTKSKYGQILAGGDTVDINVVDVDADMAIPTQAHIAEAKQRRNAARLQPSSDPTASSTTEEGFISLNVTRPQDNDWEEDRGPHPMSRLMREDDELGEGEEDAAEYTGAQERIAIGKKAREREAEKRRADIGEVLNDAQDDPDDSDREWELAQERRAAPSRPTPPPVTKPQPYRAPPIPTPTAIPTLAAPTARLALLMTDLSVRHAQNTKALEAVEREREEVTKNEARVRKEVESVGQKWAEAKAMREWVEGLAEFLDVKFPTLEKLEGEHVSLLSERAGMVNQRRQEDDSDDVALFLGIPPPTSSVDITNDVDELGRAPPDDSAHSATRRARRLARMGRRSARPPRPASRDLDEEEGFSTDSELSPGDNADLLAALTSLSTRVSSLLSDVRSEEFKDPRKGVGRRFSLWREKSREEYVNAWGGLGAVGAWEFWARLEMAGWDPMDDERSLDSFDWYDALYDYSRPRDELDDDPMEGPQFGPDGDLVSSLVSSAIVPRICALVEGGAFDVYSARHVRRLVDLTEQVEACIGRDADKFKILVRVVLHTFYDAINATISLVAPLLSSPTQTFDPAAIPARRRFLMRRLKLLSNLMIWRRYAGGADLELKRLLQEILSPVAALGWDAGGQEVLQKVAKLVPPQFLPTELVGRFG